MRYPCLECERKRPSCRRVYQFADGSFGYVCVQCWNRWAYGSFFSQDLPILW